jgi:predicted nucleic acid-binding protein
VAILAGPVLVDSSAWIEWLEDSPVAAVLEDYLPASKDWLVPTIVQLEVSKWLLRERSSEEVARFLAFTSTLEIIPLDTAIALDAAAACIEHKLATADAIIFATSQTYKATLLTCDSHFAGLPKTIVVPHKS